MELNLFWKIYLSITSLIIGIAFVSVNIKKAIEKMKEVKIQQKVTIMTIPVQKRHDQNIFIGKFNNRKSNVPMLSGKQMASIIFFSFSMILTMILLSTVINPHEVFLYQSLIFEPIFFKIVIPIIYLRLRKDFCRYLLRELQFSP